jgi:hypothetical protein
MLPQRPNASSLLCANMNETSPVSDFRLESEKGLRDEWLEWNSGSGTMANEVEVLARATFCSVLAEFARNRSRFRSLLWIARARAGVT